MKLLRFAGYLFYKYYSKGPRRPVKYLSTILAISLILFINILTIMAIFDVNGYLPERTSSRLWNYLRGGLVLLPLYFIVRYFIPEASLKKAKYEEQAVKKGNIVLILYIVFSVVIAITMIGLRQKYNIPQW